MSKLYKNYVLLKLRNPEKIYLFKSGIFCLFLDEDAKLMSKVLNLKLGNLTVDVFRCGFPYSSLDKYMNILNKLHYSVEIVDCSNNSICSYNDLVNNNSIKKLLTECASLNVDELSVSQTYEILSKIKNKSNEILINS